MTELKAKYVVEGGGGGGGGGTPIDDHKVHVYSIYSQWSQSQKCSQLSKEHSKVLAWSTVS